MRNTARQTRENRTLTVDFQMKPPTFSCLAMARRLSNASSPFSWPSAFHSPTRRPVTGADA